MAATTRSTFQACRGEAYLSLTGRAHRGAAILYTAKIALPSVGGVPLAALAPTKIVTETSRETMTKSIQSTIKTLSQSYPDTWLYFPAPLDLLYVPPDAPELDEAAITDVYFPLMWDGRRLVPDLMNMKDCCGEGPLGYKRLPLIRLPVGRAVGRVGLYESVFTMPCNSSYTHCRLLHNVATLPIIGASTGWADIKAWTKNIGEEDELRDVIVIHVDMYQGAMMARILELVNMLPHTNFVFVNYRIRADDQRPWLCADGGFFAPQADEAYEQLTDHPKTLIVYRGSTAELSRSDAMHLDTTQYEKFYHGDDFQSN